MPVDSTPRCLEGEGRSGQSEVVQGNPVGPVVPGEGLSDASEGNAGVPCPRTVAFEQATQGPLEFHDPVTGRNDIAPPLLVER